MTYERFTDRARKVMQLTNQEAQRYNHEYVGTEHLLLGLVKVEDGVAATALARLGANQARVRAETEKLIHIGPDMVTMGKLPRTPRVKKVLEYAMEEAAALGDNYICTEHLLLGMVREQEGVSAQVLQNLGLPLASVREEVLHLKGPQRLPKSAAPAGYINRTLKPAMTDHERRVCEAMIGFGQDTPNDPCIPNDQVRILRVRLLLEEVLELAAAAGVHVSLRDGHQPTPGVDIHTEVTFDQLTFYPSGTPDLVEMVDALADISVVNTGAFIACGVRMAPVLEAVDANNIAKVARGHRDEHGKFIKPDNHPKPDLSYVLALQGYHPT